MLVASDQPQLDHAHLLEASPLGRNAHALVLVRLSRLHGLWEPVGAFVTIHARWQHTAQPDFSVSELQGHGADIGARIATQKCRALKCSNYALRLSGGATEACGLPAAGLVTDRLHLKFLLQPKSVASVIIFLKGQEKLHTMGPPAPAYTRARRPPARSPCASRLPQRQRPPSPSRA